MIFSNERRYVCKTCNLSGRGGVGPGGMEVGREGS